MAGAGGSADLSPLESKSPHAIVCVAFPGKTVSNGVQNIAFPILDAIDASEAKHKHQPLPLIAPASVVQAPCRIYQECIASWSDSFQDLVRRATTVHLLVRIV